MDPISSKIITELGKDGRISNIKLAKKLGVNVLTVAKKVKVLKEKGIIEIRAVPNFLKLGYHSCLICLNVDYKKLDSICSQLIKRQNIVMLNTCFGRFDIFLVVMYRDLKMLQDFVNMEIPKIPGISHVSQYLISEKNNPHYEFFMSSLDSRITLPVSLDDTNHKLMEELSQNGNMNYSKIAKKLGTSTATISRRISMLLKEHIISFRGIPNVMKLGYSTNAMVISHTDFRKTDAICKQLLDYPNVSFVCKLMNNNGVFFSVSCVDIEELHELIKSKIANIAGMINFEIFIKGPITYFDASYFLAPFDSVDSLANL